MTWFDYFLIGWWLMGCALVAAQTGKPRKPQDPGVAVFSVIITAALIGALLLSRGAL